MLFHLKDSWVDAFAGRVSVLHVVKTEKKGEQMC
jgi:hypothetical protein